MHLFDEEMKISYFFWILLVITSIYQAYDCNYYWLQDFVESTSTVSAKFKTGVILISCKGIFFKDIFILYRIYIF